MHWNAIETIGMTVGVPAILATAYMGFRAFHKQDEKLFLAGSIGMLLSIPYQLLFVRPTHLELKTHHQSVEDGFFFPQDKENKIELKLKEWDNLVKVRTLIIAVSAALFTYAELKASGKVK